MSTLAKKGLGDHISLDANLLNDAQELALSGGTNASGHLSVQTRQAADACAVQGEFILIKIRHFVE